MSKDWNGFAYLLFLISFIFLKIKVDRTKASPYSLYMIDGVARKVEWNNFRSPNLKIELPASRGDWRCCGSASLQLVTGKSASLIEKRFPHVKKRGWFTKPLARYLVELGYTVIEVTKNSVTSVDWSDYPLSSDHCLMINGMVDNQENTWWVLHKDVLYHNLYVERAFNSLFFLNKPTQDVLLVWHKKWAKKV